MRRLVVVLMCLVSPTAAARELVHPYPSTGPAEVSGTVAASKMLRTMQRYTMPAFTDVLAMHTAQALQGESNGVFAVVRKPRQGGNEARRYVAAAVPDGGTLLFASEAAGAAPPGAGGVLQPVASVATMPYVLISTTPKHSVATLISGAGGRRHTALVATPGERTVGHLAIEAVRLRSGLRLEAVSYNGGRAALDALVTSQASVALVPLPAALPYLGDGRLVALVIADRRRHRRIAGVPTSGEARVGELQAAGVFEVFARHETSRSVLREVQAALARALDSDGSRELISGLGLQSVPPHPDRHRGISGTTSRDGFLPPS